MLLIPRISEKSYAAAQQQVYTFDVPISSNKQQIAEAVAAQFEVKVADVRTSISKGKAVRSIRSKRSTPVRAHRRDTKKAYVTLVEGDTIDAFASEETK